MTMVISIKSTTARSIRLGKRIQEYFAQSANMYIMKRLSSFISNSYLTQWGVMALIDLLERY